MNEKFSTNNKVFNGLWISPDDKDKPLSDLARLCIHSFCANGHDFHLWSYGDIPNLPSDTAPGKVIMGNAENILPKSKIYSIGRSLDGCSDWFRWELLRKIGGWCTDMNMVCLRPINCDNQIVFAMDHEKEFYHFMKFPKEHEFVVEMAEYATSRRKKPQIIPPPTLAVLVRSPRFCRRTPCITADKGRHFGWGKDYHFIVATGVNTKTLLKDCYAFHCLDADKNNIYRPESPYEILKRRYLPECKSVKAE